MNENIEKIIKNLEKENYKKEDLENLDKFVKEKYKDYMMSLCDGEFSKYLQDKFIREIFPKEGKIGVGGAKGSYADQVSHIIFPKGKINYYKKFDQILDAIDENICDFGILPLENSSFGSVKEVYNLMLERNFFIIGNYKLDINHYLLGNLDAKLSDIKTVYSHPQALGQCGKYINKHGFIQKEYYNTALASKYIKEKNDKKLGAIGSKFCANVYKLKIIDENIQNESNNYTRFIIVSKNLKIYEKANKISIRLKAFDKPGSLINIVEKFKILGVNMTKLESSPIPGSDFEFVFYFDFEGSIKEKRIRSLLDFLYENTRDFEFMGAYIDFNKAFDKNINSIYNQNNL
ncbi:MAG: prephenate dehydratase [Anaerococcus vaginalis]|uniref:prephenate dehydratase n=1 Tax=Anaerococcus vaginalis TaxID=33037 RepID=UPI0029032182|nr:prephenate dehydratase [Anaerococcus vaginalis]MDU0944833.1 prephenate dehydratase [Anaerococcus vaginalis]MDU1030073.1 prephenate dehydratase [Anaerococcus vaginalis]MDU5374182.1 prephenate dehydratase [Anaerococcus vaginalis]